MQRIGKVMDKVKVAVIGTGPTGLSIAKNLRDDGFDVTCYERRHQVGGLWAYSEDPSHTTAFRFTRANISKFTCGFSDFPMPDKYPTHLSQTQFQEFIESYAKHFDLLKTVIFGANVKQVRRTEDDTRWVVEFEKDGKRETAEYDKVALCHGYQTEANVPVFEGQEKFEGTILHSQAFRDPTAFKSQTVVVVGLKASAGDIIPSLMPLAKRVYVSHRRGAVPVSRYRNGTPADLLVTHRRKQAGQFLQRYFPGLARWAADKAVAYLCRGMFGALDPAWRLEPFPSVTLTLPGPFEFVMPYLRDGSLTSLHGVRRFVGPRSVEFADGTVVEDVDAVVLCTGYRADFGLVAPWLETSTPEVLPDWYKGPKLYRMYLNLFPPRYADSCALLCYSAFGKANGFSFADLTGMALSNVWRGVERLPSREAMERHVDEHHRWVADRWRQEPFCDTSAVRQWEFQGFLHRAAGTGMEALGWGWAGWKFWWKDPEMYKLMAHGVDTSHAFRYFETGKRKTWPGARDAIIHMNELVKAFPLKEEEVPKYEVVTDYLK